MHAYLTFNAFYKYYCCIAACWDLNVFTSSPRSGHKKFVEKLPTCPKA